MFNIKNQRIRAKYLKIIRDYFYKKDVLEVDTPLAYKYPVTDPLIDTFAIDTQQGKRYLQTSPEYAMKRFLAMGSGSIYQVCKAFRDDPLAQLHNYEFTMLEWYRVGIDHYHLMQEMVDMFLLIKPSLSFEFISYKDVFVEYYGFNPHCVSLEFLHQQTIATVGDIQGLEIATIADYLDILFSAKIEKNLNKKDTLYFVYNYTLHQSALARKIEEDDELQVARFELFKNGIELGNGYYELIDKKEQTTRFENDLEVRKKQNIKSVPIDYELLDCLDNVPECAGVAVGLERLIMAIENIENIDEIVLI